MPDTPALHDQVHDIDKILQRVQRGDNTVLPALRALLTERSELATILGDMAEHVQAVLIEQIAEGNQGMRLCIETTMQEHKKRLAGPQPSALETLLIERIMLDWLALHLLELYDVMGQKKSRTVVQAEYMAKRIDHAHRRYHRSLMALAQVRRLMTPMVLLQMGLHAPRNGVHSPVPAVVE